MLSGATFVMIAVLIWFIFCFSSQGNEPQNGPETKVLHRYDNFIQWLQADFLSIACFYFPLKENESPVKPHNISAAKVFAHIVIAFDFFFTDFVYSVSRLLKENDSPIKSQDVSTSKVFVNAIHLLQLLRTPFRRKHWPSTPPPAYYYWISYSFLKENEPHVKSPNGGVSKVFD